MREKLTVSLDTELIKKIEDIRTKKTTHARTIDDKSHFIEKLLIIGLEKYSQSQHIFDRLNLNNVDITKLNF